MQNHITKTCVFTSVTNDSDPKLNSTKLRGLSHRANYIDRAIAACRRSWCQLLRLEGAKWSEFLATDPEVRLRFPALPDFLRSSGSGTGPLSLVSTTEELL
jgi:hypothetical protein